MRMSGAGSAPIGETVNEVPLGAHAAPKAASESGKKSHGEILKSSALIGGSAGLNMLLGLVRNKVLALLLGAEGFGLFGIFTSISELARGIAGAHGLRDLTHAAAGDAKPGDAPRQIRDGCIRAEYAETRCP